MPPKVTSGLARSRVSGKSRSPAPPASKTPRVSFIWRPPFASGWRFGRYQRTTLMMLRNVEDSHAAAKTTEILAHERRSRISQSQLAFPLAKEYDLAEDGL